jgi:sulfite reductase (NADPH) flavoprotein alpha-component
LGDFERKNTRVGHENAGFLSASHGFMPRAPPLTSLHSDFRTWDQLAAELPALHSSLELRRRVEQLPLLDASEGALDDREVLRACALLAVVAHAYWYVEPSVPTRLPEAVRRPWAQLRERLGRRDEVISYIDLVVYNWRLLDARRADPIVVENLDLLLPTIGNQEERVFYLTQLEILSRAAPIVRLVAAAQDAVLAPSNDALEAALLGIIDCLRSIVQRSLPKIDPNPYSPTHVNPVIWAKTVAPFAVPFQQGVQGPSGTSSPIFNTLDLFFGRKDFASFLGREIKQLRGLYPPAWQSFLRALTQVSVADHIERCGSRALSAAFRDAFELYAGENGFLGRHRMKVYGYLELAFKVGRSITIGGFSGVFTDRTWDVVDNELSAAQSERRRLLPNTVPPRRQSRRDPCHWARVASVVPGPSQAAAPVQRVTLDIENLGVRYRPGDRCLILPENDAALVTRTLFAMDAEGDERVALTDEWKAVAQSRRELQGATRLTIRDVLRFGGIRPVSLRLAEALHACTQSAAVRRLIVRSDVAASGSDDCAEPFELCELLEALKAEGVSPRSLWQQADAQVSDRLCRLIPPLDFRVYSISSPSRDARGGPSATIELTIGERHGTASTFLLSAHQHDRLVPFYIERPARFALPDDPKTPIVMFGGGTGVAPFRAFLQERMQDPLAGTNWLFLSLRSPDEFLYADEFSSAHATGRLRLQLAFTRAGANWEQDAQGRFTLGPGPTRRIEDLMLAPEAAAQLSKLLLPKRAGGAGAHVYICGRGSFADCVIETLKEVFRRHASPSSSRASIDEFLYRLIGEQRLLQEIHTGSVPRSETTLRFDLSEIAEHNDPEKGYWVIIDRVVYDVTEFLKRHPGGRRVLQAYAGMDASHGYARAHSQRMDVDAMRESYRIGVVRSYEFEHYAVAVEGDSGPVTVDCTAAHRAFVSALQLVVEMQNALSADQSLQYEKLGPDELSLERTPYKLARAVETHRRFLANYVDVLASQTLPSLWRMCQGLFFPGDSPSWMQERLGNMRQSPDVLSGASHVRKLADEFELWKHDPRTVRAADIFEATDRWLIRAIKRTLIDGLRQFERHGVRTRELGAMNLRNACQRGASLLEEYYACLARELGLLFASLTTLEDAEAPDEDPPPALHRLHTGTHWTFEEDPTRGLAVLTRTPLALTSLADLSAENDKVLGCLSDAHRGFGLVVDVRRAPLRNDGAFEDAMARLRAGLTRHFRRTAVLLESNTGELQVSRLERDERGHALATRSESSAYKFALGGR